MSRASALASILFLVAAPASAGVVTGRVVDAQGNGIAGVDLDFDPSSGGGSPTVSQDFTDAAGYFTTTVLPDGVYRIELFPPAGSLALYKRIDDVAIVGTQNLGNVVLTTGVALSGRAVNASGAGVFGVNIDVLDAAGNDVTLVGDQTDALGYFSIAAPAGSSELRLIPTPASGAVLAPRALAIALTSALDVGSVVLSPGFVVTADVKRASTGAALANVELAVELSAGGASVFTPGNRTNSSGFVDIVLAAGTYDFRVSPPFSQQLVTEESVARTVGADTFLGVFQLDSGVVLSGSVVGPSGQPCAGVDVDVELPSTGVEIPLSDDNTNTSGSYAVIVPTGTYRINFEPPYSQPLGSQTFENVVVTANKVQNASLPACPFFTTVGSAISGSGGIAPAISASGGAPRIGNTQYRLHCSQGLGGSKSVVQWSLLPTPTPLPNPLQVVPPMTRKVVLLGGTAGTPGAGSGSYAFPIADDPLLAGRLLRAWFYVRDASAPNGLSRTHELRATISL